MNTAQTIVNSVHGERSTIDYNEAVILCDAIMEAVEQDFELETTIFLANDGSKIKFDGVSMTVSEVK